MMMVFDDDKSKTDNEYYYVEYKDDEDLTVEMKTMRTKRQGR